MEGFLDSIWEILVGIYEFLGAIMKMVSSLYDYFLIVGESLTKLLGLFTPDELLSLVSDVTMWLPPACIGIVSVFVVLAIVFRILGR